MDFLVFIRMPQSPSQRLATIDDLLLYRLSQLSAAAGAMVVRLCEGSHGVTRREWGVVAQLYGHQGLLPSELAERMRRDRARTSRALTALLGKGLIERVTLPHDRRSARVSLTPAGRQLYEVLMPQVQAINAQLVSVLSADEVAAFDDVLERLRQQANAMQGQWDLVLPKANRHLGRTSSTVE
jgi:DNA-binding MarR family transcriptional regulator